MRNLLALSLVLAITVGCATTHERANPAALSYSFYPTDVAQASAQSIDANAARGAIEPGYQAELHLKLSDAGVERFERFNQACQGQEYDVLINGEVLASGLTAQPRGPVVEMVWYVDSMEQAKRFADVLSAR